MFAINWDTLILMSKFGAIMLGILLLVFILACLTPKLAKLTDKLLDRKSDKNSVPTFPEEKLVRSIYDGETTSENDDPNL